MLRESKAIKRKKLQQLEDFNWSFSGEWDGLPHAFYLVGNIDEATVKVMKLEMKSNLKKWPLIFIYWPLVELFGI